MNRKIGIIIGVVLFIVIILAAVLFQSNIINPPASTIPTGTPSIAPYSIQAGTRNYREFISSGRSEICTFSASINNSLSNGTIYAALGKIRGDISYTGSKGTYQQHLIVDAYVAYMWSNTGNSGIKFTVTDQSPADTISSLPNMVCSPWQPNTAVFDLPSDIVFTEITDVIIPTLGPDTITTPTP